MTMDRIDCLELYYLHEYKRLKEDHLDKLLIDNIDTVTKFLLKTPEYIISLTGMTPSEYEQFTNEIFLRCRPQTTSLLALTLSSRNNRIFSTGIKKLDEILQGGLYGGEILEIYGPSGTGKTQMCLSIAAHFCHHQKDSMVAYLDLNNDFVPQRFYELCQGSVDSLDRIYLVRENKVKDIIDITENFEKKLCAAETTFGEELRVLILDSLPMAFYPCMDEDNILLQAYQERLSQSLRRLSIRYDIVVVVTNHSISNKFEKHSAMPSTSTKSVEYSDEPKPALGQYWFTVPHFRLFLTQTEFNSSFRARLCKSSRTPLDETFEFKITNTGID